MDVYLGKFRVSISKIAKDAAIGDHQLTSEELDQLLARVSPLPHTPSSKLLSDVVVQDVSTSAGQVQATAALQNHGIFIVPDFLDRDLALDGGRLAFEIAGEARSAAAVASQPKGFSVETSGRAGYYEMASSGSAVVNLRQGSDAGMADIFNFDRVTAKTGTTIRSALACDSLMEILSVANGGEWRPANLNAYINQDITHTRMFHVDSYGAGQVKAFLYMTDVDSLSDGPYCYVVDSHKPGPYRDMNLALSRASSIFSSTDTPIVDTSKILPILAPAGSLVVSNQSGSHRGAPQAAGHARAIAVLNILPAKR